MKSKWKRRRDPRPPEKHIRGNNRQMTKVQIQKLLTEEENNDAAELVVPSHGSGGNGKADAA